ncbi:MAG: MerR family transcriptional regulator [Bacilli bacterium]|jgi:DNA-binding transcriptional MerR regulator
MKIENKLFKIAEVANFLGVSTTTLRYYEQYGFIKPSKIDEFTGYRYYDIRNIGEITHIIDLRRLGLSMRQIENYLHTGFDAQEYTKELKRNRDVLNMRIKLSELRFGDHNAYNVEFISTQSSYCLSREGIASNVADLEVQFANYLMEILKRGYVLDRDFLTLIEFDSVIPKFRDIKYKMIFMIREAAEGCHRFPGINGIHTYHKGSYKTIDKAYSALIDFAVKNNLKLKGTAIENYFRSSFTVDSESNMLTDVILPLEQ